MNSSPKRTRPLRSRRDARGAEQAVAEEAEVEHRRAAAALDRDPSSGSSTAATAKPTITIVSFQPERPPRETASISAVRPRDERHRAAEVEAARAVGPRELTQHEPRPTRAGDRERHVEPEDPVPRDRDERATEHRTDHEPDRADHRVGAHRQAELLAREGVGDERRASWRTGTPSRVPAGRARGSARSPLAAKPAPSDAAAKTRKPPT